MYDSFKQLAMNSCFITIKMGSKTSCQGLNCSEASIGTCKCSNQRFCRRCYESHRFELQNVSHSLISHSNSILPDEPQAITMKSITLTKQIYRSPEGSTEVHEGLIKFRPGKYAIKIMHCMNEADLAKKQKESEMQMGMKHQSICECITSFRDETYTSGCRFVIVMEFSEDGDIEQDIEKRKLKKNPWTEAEILGHFAQLIDAFAFMQDNNLTHGDVKPRNLYLAADGKIKIGDFGESKQSMQALVTQTYQVTGTVIYFSPLLFEAYLNIIKGKNLKGEVRHNPIKSDVYSLGLSFLHMASLNKPTELNNLELGVDILQLNIDKTISKLQYSDTIKNLLLKMLQVQESKRYDFKQLRSFLNPEPGDAKTFEISPKSKQPPTKGSKSLLVSISQMQGIAVLLDFKYKISKLNSHRFQSSSRAILWNDSVIITGGLKNNKNVFKINVGTCAATKLQDMNKGRAWHTLLLHQGAFYVIGGRDEEKKTIDGCEKLALQNEEIINESWSTGSCLNMGRENATGISMGEKIYIFGGSFKNGNKWQLTDSIEVFCEGTWRYLNVRLNKPASGIGLVCPDNETIWLVGGSLDKGSLSKSIYHFNLRNSEESDELEESKISAEDEDYFNSQTSFIDGNGDIFMLGNHLNGFHKYEHASREWKSVKN